jgi:membrane-associated phospholipid phosphatase
MGTSLSTAQDTDPDDARGDSAAGIPGAHLPPAGLPPDEPRGADATAAFLLPTGHDLASSWVERTGTGHPVRTVVGGYLVAWAALAAGMTAMGLLLTKAVLAGGYGRWDETVNRWLADHRIAPLDRLTGLATFMANTLPVVVLLVVATAVLLLRRRLREALFLVGALAYELSVFLVANALVDRPRPDVPRLDSTPSTSSFPSGHIAATLAFWCGTALIVNATVRNRVVRVLVWVVAVVMTVNVAFARVYRGMHHVTDVSAGAILGIGALAASIFAVRVLSAVVAARRSTSTARAASAPPAPPVPPGGPVLGVRP